MKLAAFYSVFILVTPGKRIFTMPFDLQRRKLITGQQKEELEREVWAILCIFFIEMSINSMW